jgi:hypothetical protein
MTAEPIVFIKEVTIPSAERVGENELVEVERQVIDPATGKVVTITILERQLTFGNWDELNQATNEFYTAEIPREMAYTWAGPEAVVNVLPNQGSYWNSFLLLSGWTQERPDAIEFYDISGDNQWWFLKSAKFATDFSKLNPDADWSTAWRLYFEPDSAVEQTRLLNKMIKIDDLFSMLEIF